MSASDLAPPAAGPPAAPGPAAYRQFPTAWRFALRNQTRNRLAGLLLVAFVPVWYLLMLVIAGHQPLSFRLYATGRVLSVDAGHLTLISAGLNSLTIIVGFAVFAAIRRTLAFDQRLVFAGYRHGTLIAAKTLAIVMVAAGVALYTAAVLLAFWRPGPAGWASILAGFAVMALTYGALGLLLGVRARLPVGASRARPGLGRRLRRRRPDHLPHPHPRAHSPASAQGSITSMPVPSKSDRLRVASVAWRDRQTAAMRASNPGIGFPARSRVLAMVAYCSAAASSTGNT